MRTAEKYSKVLICLHPKKKNVSVFSRCFALHLVTFSFLFPPKMRSTITFNGRRFLFNFAPLRPIGRSSISPSLSTDYFHARVFFFTFTFVSFHWIVLIISLYLFFGCCCRCWASLCRRSSVPFRSNRPRSRSNRISTRCFRVAGLDLVLPSFFL